MQLFSSEQELFEYVESPDYMNNRQNPGICFAFEIVADEDSNTYQAKLYYQDHSIPGMHFANGIPDQQQSVFNPARQAPNMNAFEQYSRRGFAYLHNLMANQVLIKVTGDASANISLMTSPVPGAVNI